jgi:hypothetical protein
MSTTYPQQQAYTLQQPVMHTPTGTYYQTAAVGQPVYYHDPSAAIRQQTVVAAPPSTVASWFDYTNTSYLKGLVVGAGVALLVTNPTVQSVVVKGAVAAWTAVVGGVEEIKERVRDARAEKSMT